VSEGANDTTSKPAAAFAQFDLLLSLDVAIELIQTDRESLKRCETFAGYPGHYGHRVRDTIEEIFVLLLQAMGERHLEPGFRMLVSY
jgi:recyclin-1